jgi:predicted enzyme related to lactoylglutathione lyase
MINGISAVWLPVSDMDRAVDFYEQKLGLTVKERQPEWSELELDGQCIGLNGRPEETAGGDGGALIAFSAGDGIEAEVERLKGEGVEFSGDISDHPWGRIVPFKDPDGNDLQLFAPPA